MINSIEQYLAELKKELTGSDHVTIQNALADAEEYLRTALANAREDDKSISEAEVLADIIKKYGTPKEVAAAYESQKNAPEYKGKETDAGYKDSRRVGPIVTRSYDIKDFTGIDVGNAFKVTVTQSDEYSVTITAGEDFFKHLNVSKDGSTLVIGFDMWFISWFLNWFRSPRLTVTMPVLKKLVLSGASKGTASGFNSPEDLKLHVSGASHLDIDMEAGDFFADISGASKITGKLTATSSEIELSGASHINLTGSGGNINIHGSGASSVEMAEFTVNNAYIDFSGASHAALNINGKLEVDLSGASSLEYTGNPTIGKKDIKGFSHLNHVSSR